MRTRSRQNDLADLHLGRDGGEVRHVGEELLAVGLRGLLEILERNGLLKDRDYATAAAGGVLQRFQALMEKKHAGTLLLSPFEVQAEARGFNRLANATDVLGRYQLLEEQLGIDVGDDAPCPDHVAALDFNTARAAALDNHFLHASPGSDVDVTRRALLGHRLRNCTHAAKRVPPLTALAVHFAEHVMEQHVGRSRLIRTREIADNRIEPKRRLDRLRFEPTIEDVARALGHQVEQVAPFTEIELAKLPADLPGIEERAEILPAACADVGRRLAQQLAEERCCAIEHRVILRQPFRVARGKFRDFGLRRGQSAADF